MSEEYVETHDMRERFLKSVYDLRNSSSLGIRQLEIMERMGLNTDDQNHAGLYESITGYWVQKGCVRSFADGYGMIQITAEGIDYVEGRTQGTAPGNVTFNVGNAYGSIFGTQQHAQILQQSFSYGDLEEEIEERGGEDAEALKQMISEIRSLLEQQDSLDRSRFEKWSELLNRHAWITGPIAQLLLLYATTGQIHG